MPFLLPNQQRQSTEGQYVTLARVRNFNPDDIFQAVKSAVESEPTNQHLLAC